MPHPRVVEMRRRLMRIMRLAEKAARSGNREKVHAILARWEKGEITYQEAMKKLKALASA